MAQNIERIPPHKELQYQLEARAARFAAELPRHITAASFVQTILTACAQNPQLLQADRMSLLVECQRAAHDGLPPDGHHAVLLVYKSKRGPVARYIPMLAGIRQKVQQSGEITRFDQAVVYSADRFSFARGDTPHILHEPALAERGEPIAVYSIAQFRDGTLSREVMSAADVEKVRQASRAKDDGPWQDWRDEMWIKTVAKRHAKVLPMSSAVRTMLDDDEDEIRPAVLNPLPTERRPLLSERSELDPAPPVMPASDSGRHHAPPPDDMPADDMPAELPDDSHAESIDFIIGAKDAEAGRSGCLNRDIKNDAARLADWQRGFNSVKGKP